MEQACSKEFNLFNSTTSQEITIGQEVKWVLKDFLNLPMGPD